MYPDTFEGFAVHSADEWNKPKRHEVGDSNGQLRYYADLSDSVGYVVQAQALR